MLLPTARLLWLLAAASALFLIDARAALAADALLTITALADWWSMGGSRFPRVLRVAPRHILRDERGRVRITVHNPGRRTLRLILTDDLPPRLERVGEAKQTVVVGPSETVEVAYAVLPVVRGPARLGDLHVRVRCPLGLAWRQGSLHASEEIRVLPRAPDVHRFRLVGLRRRLREVGLRNTRQRGEGRSFESLRPYIRGDDPRAIDWKATARHATVMVRQYEAERSQSVVIALDVGRVMLEAFDERDRLDHAMTAALLLADVAVAHGDRVGLLLFADRVQQFLPPRRASTLRIADALGLVQGRMVEPNYPLAFATLARQVHRRSLVVLFTDVVDAMASSALITQVSRSAARHLVLAVTMRNPALARLAGEAAPTREAAYRRAAAEEMLWARASALANMRRSGALVADVDPDAVASDVVNRYLDVKYRSLL